MRLGIVLLFSIGCSAVAKQPTEIVQEYLKARAATMRGDATAADVDRVIAFYTEDAVYEDPAVKVRVEGKERHRAGMISHLSDYAGSEARVSAGETVRLANAVAVVVTEVFAVSESGRPRKIERKRLQVFEFRGDKICRVIDYH